MTHDGAKGMLRECESTCVEFLWYACFFLFVIFFGWGPGIEELLTRERDSYATTVKTDENHQKSRKS